MGDVHYNSIIVVNGCLGIGCGVVVVCVHEDTAVDQQFSLFIAWRKGSFDSVDDEVSEFMQFVPALLHKQTPARKHFVSGMTSVMISETAAGAAFRTASSRSGLAKLFD